MRRQPRERLRTDAPQPADGHRREVLGLITRRDRTQPVGLGFVARDLRDHLARGDSGADRETDFVADGAAHAFGITHRSREIEIVEPDERLVERETLDRARTPREDCEHALRCIAIALEVRRDYPQLRAERTRLIERHRGTHAKWPRFVRRGKDNRAPAIARNRERQPTQRWIVALRDACIERIDIEVRDHGTRSR